MNKMQAKNINDSKFWNFIELQGAGESCELKNGHSYFWTIVKND